jgi:hypothetical protein
MSLAKLKTELLTKYTFHEFRNIIDKLENCSFDNIDEVDGLRILILFREFNGYNMLFSYSIDKISEIKVNILNKFKTLDGLFDRLFNKTFEQFLYECYETGLKINNSFINNLVNDYLEINESDLYKYSYDAITIFKEFISNKNLLMLINHKDFKKLLQTDLHENAEYYTDKVRQLVFFTPERLKYIDKWYTYSRINQALCYNNFNVDVFKYMVEQNILDYRLWEKVASKMDKTTKTFLSSPYYKHNKNGHRLTQISKDIVKFLSKTFNLEAIKKLIEHPSLKEIIHRTKVVLFLEKNLFEEGMDEIVYYWYEASYGYDYPKLDVLEEYSSKIIDKICDIMISATEKMDSAYKIKYIYETLNHVIRRISETKQTPSLNILESKITDILKLIDKNTKIYLDMKQPQNKVINPVEVFGYFMEVYLPKYYDAHPEKLFEHWEYIPNNIKLIIFGKYKQHLDKIVTPQMLVDLIQLNKLIG